MPTCYQLMMERNSLLGQKSTLEGQINTLETDIALAEGNILQSDVPDGPIDLTNANITARINEIDAELAGGGLTQQRIDQLNGWKTQYAGILTMRAQLLVKQGELASIEAELADIQAQGVSQGCWA